MVTGILGRGTTQCIAYAATVCKIGSPNFPTNFRQPKIPSEVGEASWPDDGWQPCVWTRSARQRIHIEMSSDQKKTGSICCSLGDEKLPRYIGIIVRYSKPLLYVSRIPMNQSGFHGSCQSRVLLPLLSCWQALSQSQQKRFVQLQAEIRRFVKIATGKRIQRWCITPVLIMKYRGGGSVSNF